MGVLSDVGNGLGQLGGMIANQFLQGENSEEQRSLKAKLNGKENQYGKLGDFAKKIDQSAQRNYLEEGYLDNSFNNTSAKMREIIMQQPEATVLVRKKMYTSLASNYATEYMSEEERLVYLAMDKLFANKAKQISAYEKLCKIQKASQKMGEVNDSLLPIIIGFDDAISSTVSAFSSGPFSMLGKFGDVIRKVKAVYNYSKSNFYTTWIEDVLTPSYLRHGGGLGVIEFTNFTNITTSVGISGTHDFSLSFDDPYNLMTVTMGDIEAAISEVINVNNSFGPNLDSSGEELFGAGSSIALGKEIAGDLIENNINLLNRVRASRGASPISFKIDPNSLYGRKVIAIVDRVGQEIPFNAKNMGIPWSSGVSVEAPYLKGGASLGEEGLATSPDKNFTNKNSKYNSNVRINVSSELELFSDVIKSIFTKINLDKNSERKYDFAHGDDLINYIRKKLIFYFAGKNIIQPMDTVNIYISSQTNADGRIMSGIKDVFSGFGLFNNISNQMQQVSNSFNAIFSPSNNLDLQMEKSLILGEGNNVPNHIWLMLRDTFTAEKEGCHVYAGIFKTVTTKYGDGSYSVSASGSDNTYYLQLSQVNFNPGAANTTGSFHDPLTIYQTKFDSVYGDSDEISLPLLKENQAIMSDIQHPLRVTSGPRSGAVIKDGNIPSEVDYTQVGYSPSGQKVIFAPDGLVYKWKEGIKTLELRGSATSIASSPSFSQQSAIADSLANQDVMNCVSLLVTGTPYNYYAYYKAGTGLGGNLKLNADRTALDASKLTELLESISKNKLIWGKFIPYKSISVTSSQFSEMMSLKNQELIKNQTSLNKLYKEADILRNSLIVQSLNLDTANYNIKAVTEKYKGSLESLYSRIESAQQKFISAISDPNYSHFSMIGNDISFDSDYFVVNGGDDPSLQNKKQLRRKNQFLTRRLSWQVRQNSDNNYLIVDDSYDKNNDLLSFEGTVTGQKINLFGTELNNVYDKVASAANVLNMEFFADTQGHLRIRTPQYNKMPSSVFLTLLKNKNNKRKVQIFPKFLNNLLLDQLKNVYNKLSAIEDEIRLLCCILGVGNDLQAGGDNAAIKYIRGTETPNSKKYNKKDFNFISSPVTGKIVDYEPFNSSSQNLDNGLKPSSFLAIKQLKDKVQNQINIKNTFDIASRITKFKSDLASLIKQEDDIDDQLITFEKTKQNIEKLVSRIFEKTGEIIKPEKYINPLFSDANLILNQISFPKVYAVPSFELNNLISLKINERQKLVKQLYFFANSTYEFNALDNPDEAMNYFRNPNSPNAPEIFDHLLEDENYDDLGPGSGSRYIIKNSQIISYSFNENKPAFTGLTVTGRLAKNIPADQSKTDWRPLPDGGNPLTSSSALDYDLWKMYGYIWGKEKSYPLLTDPNSQTTPVAVGLLMGERKKIFTATVEIIGNEYMQPGEVVFLEQIGMLFYVEKVAHTFGYSGDGGSFTTSLSLSYGHFPGEYIPNLTDLVGKLLYVNRDTSGVSIKKGLPNTAGTSVGALAMINRDVAKNFDKKNPLLLNNIRFINKIASELRKEISSNSQSNLKTVLNILIYKSKTYENISRPLANELRNILLGISSVYKVEDVSFKPFTEDQIPAIQEVDLSDEKEKRGPSVFAYGIAGNLISKKTFTDVVKAAKTPTGTAQLRNKYVCNYMVDCFVKTYPK